MPQQTAALPDLGAAIDGLASAEAVQSNCMFQLALMLARVAVEPCSEGYKEETAQALLGLLRAKPRSNVVRLFGVEARPERSDLRHLVSR